MDCEKFNDVQIMQESYISVITVREWGGVPMTQQVFTTSQAHLQNGNYMSWAAGSSLSTK